MSTALRACAENHGVEAVLSDPCSLIDDLDLMMVKRKLCLPPPEGKGWSAQWANECEIWYKRYLKLCFMYPEIPFVPTEAIDEMWHGHILDTEKYLNDCLKIFGDVLHHYPYFGLRSAEDAQNRAAAFDTTCVLYQQHFGALPSGVGMSCNSGGGGRCGRGCSRK